MAMLFGYFQHLHTGSKCSVTRFRAQLPNFVVPNRRQLFLDTNDSGILSYHKVGMQLYDGISDVRVSMSPETAAGMGLSPRTKNLIRVLISQLGGADNFTICFVDS